MQERAELLRGDAAEEAEGAASGRPEGSDLAPADAPAPALDVVEEVAGDAEGEEVDRRAADDLIRAEVDGEERVDEREQRAGEDADEPGRRPSRRSCPRPRRRRRRPSASSPRGRCSRRRSARRTSRRATAKSSGVVKTSVSETSVDHVTTSERLPALARVMKTPPIIADQAARDRSPACPARALADRPGADRDAGAADDQRGGDRARRHRRQHEPEREDAQRRSRHAAMRTGVRTSARRA